MLTVNMLFFWRQLLVLGVPAEAEADDRTYEVKFESCSYIGQNTTCSALHFQVSTLFQAKNFTGYSALFPPYSLWIKEFSFVKCRYAVSFQ